MENRVRLADICSFVKGDVNSRCVIEGERVYHSDHVILCGLDDSIPLDNHFKILALCLKTTEDLRKPYQVKGILMRTEESLKIVKMSCTCIGGAAGTCKHSVAVLLYCNNNDVSNLEQVSATDLKCKWNCKQSMVKANYDAVPIQDFPCCVKRPRKIVISDEQAAENRRILMEACPNSAISMSKNRKRAAHSSR